MSEKPEYRYEILPRPKSVGGGLRLCCYHLDEEVMGGVFPFPENATEEDIQNVYSDVLDDANEWLDSRN